MFRSIIGFAVFAVLALVAIKIVLTLFGFALGVAMTLLVWAGFGFLIYLAIRVISPGTAARIREAIRGRPA